MPISNANMHVPRRYLPLINGNSRFLQGLEGFWPLTESQGQRWNNLLYPSTYMYKLGSVNNAYANSSPFGMVFTVNASGLYGTRVINSDLGMWTRFDAIEHISMSIWVKLSSSNSTDYDKYLYGWYAGEGEFMGFQYDSGTNKMIFRLQFPIEDPATYASNLFDNTWHFLSMTWNWEVNNIYLYLDGVLVDTEAITQHGSPGSAPLLGIGSDGDGDALLGDYFGAAFWTWDLTAADMWYLYNNPFELMTVRQFSELNSVSSSRIPDLMPFFVS